MKKEKIIGQIPLFSGMPDEGIGDVAAIAEVRDISKGEIIFSEGQHALALFILAEGIVELVKYAADGSERFVRRVGRGETFAEAAMFSGGSYPVTAIARSPCQLLAIQKDKFLSYVKKHPEASMAMMGAMAQLLHHWNDLLAEFSLLSVESRLAAWLLKRSKQTGGHKFKLGIQKKELAFRLGTVPETLSRNFRKLKEIGAIELSGEQITLKDIKSLESIIGQ